MLRFFGLIFLFSLLACQSRYSHIPRAKTSGKSSELKSNWGHFVGEDKIKLEPVDLPESDLNQMNSQLGFIKDSTGTKEVLNKVINFRVKRKEGLIIPHKDKMVSEIDSTQVYTDGDKKGNDAAVVFGFLAAINLLWILPSPVSGVGFVFILFIGLASVIYLSKQFIQEMVNVKLNEPNADKPGSEYAFYGLRKFANRLLIISLALYSIAFILLLGASFQGAAIFAAFAGTFLTIGLLLRFIAIIGKLMY